MNKIPLNALSDGNSIPQIGFGCYKIENTLILDQAIRLGYRLFDTASFYENERLVGEAIQRSGKARNEFFITSKIWKTQMGGENTRKALAETLNQLQMESLDLYLIHWPRPNLICDWEPILRDTWQAMEAAVQSGSVRSIGVSNFFPHHLEVILKVAGIKPVLNQIEFHPGYMQKDVLEFCRNNKIAVQAWSPLARGRLNNSELLIKLAKKYNRSLPQLCIRFALQQGVLPIIKTNSQVRLAENIQVFDFELEESDLQRISEMPLTGWSGENPDQPKSVTPASQGLS